MQFSIGRGFAEVQSVNKMKLVVSLEPYEIFWNLAYTLIVTRYSPGNCKIAFSIGRGFAEVQIEKKWQLSITLELGRVGPKIEYGSVSNLGMVKKSKHQGMHSRLVV